jgi:hypothetical protein
MSCSHDEKMVADEEHGMYVSGMDPTKGPIRLSSAQAATQRLYARATREAGFPDPPQSVRLSTDAMTMEEAEAATTRSRAVVASASSIEMKAAGVPADDPTMGQQVPSYPIVPFSGGSGAGGFRGVDGSGSIGAVCDLSSPARKPGS